MRSPYKNIASMVSATGIPDWCYVETVRKDYNFSDFRTPTKKELAIMWDKSPIANIKHAIAPSLMELGMKDRRVPPHRVLNNTIMRSVQIICQTSMVR